MLKRLYKKYAQIPIAMRAAMWFVICSLMQKCISFVTVPIFTRLMPIEQYGLYSTYLSIYSIMTVICTLSMEKCVYINGIAKAKNEKEKDEIAIPLLSLAGTITLIVFIVYILFHNFFNRMIGLTTLMVCLMFAQIAFEPSVMYWTYKQRFEYKYIALVLVTVGMILSNSVLGIIFVVISQHEQAIARVCSVVLVQIVFGMLLYVIFIVRAKRLFSTKGWKHALKVQLPLLPHSLSLIILASSDRIMINTMAGAVQAAIYSVAYSSGYVIGTLKNSIVSAMTPWIYKKIEEKNFNDIREKTKPVMLLITVLTFIFISFAPEIIMLMAPAQYQEAVYVIPPVAASSYFTFLYNMFSNISFYYEETKKIMVASIIGAILNLVLNAICIPKFGYIAAGYTTLICYIVFTFAHYYIMKAICKKKLDNANLFDMPFIICLSLFVLIMTILFAVVYSHMYIRYGIMIGLLVFMFKNREKLIGTLKTMKKRGN